MKEIFMVGGGPSLKDFDWKRLDGKDCFAINRSYEVLPNAKYLYFADWDFWGRHQKGLLAHSCNIDTGYAKNLCKKQIVHDRVTEYKLTGADGLDTKSPGIRHGRNGGYAAINVAYHLGYKRIYLLGYDMGRVGGESHWHNGHPRIDPESIYKTMMKHYDNFVQPLKNAKIEVFNLNPNSNLKVFPFMDVYEAIGDKNPVPAPSKAPKVRLDV